MTVVLVYQVTEVMWLSAIPVKILTVKWRPLPDPFRKVAPVAAERGQGTRLPERGRPKRAPSSDGSSSLSKLRVWLYYLNAGIHSGHRLYYCLVDLFHTFRNFLVILCRHLEQTMLICKDSHVAFMHDLILLYETLDIVQKWSVLFIKKNTVFIVSMCGVITAPSNWQPW